MRNRPKVTSFKFTSKDYDAIEELLTITGERTNAAVVRAAIHAYLNTLKGGTT